MTSREIIQAVLEFDSPPRIGWQLDDDHLDLAGGGRAKDHGRETLEPRGREVRRWRDEWGVTWASLTEFDKGEVVEPAIADWDQLDSYQPPDLGRREDYDACREHFAADSEHFRVASLPGFTFNIARKLRRLDNYLCDLALEGDRIARLHEVVRSELIKAIDCLADAGADAIMFPEDWGTQDRLMISPEMWRDIFKPEFRALAGRAHERGMYVFMHSCGKMTAIIDDLIECGVNLLQFDQPRLHGIDHLADRFGGRVTFFCPVDIQRTLQTRDPDQIRAEARLLIDRLGRGGGFIAGRYPSDASIGLDPSIQDIASAEFIRHGATAR
jgi:hypothetical protein